MIFKTLINTSLILGLFFVLGVSANSQVNSSMATPLREIQATATVVADETDEVNEADRALWVWRNEFRSNAGIVSSVFHGNVDTVPGAGKSCMTVDDFQVGEDSIWSIDTIRTFLFWNVKPPDRIRCLIMADFWGTPLEDSIFHDFTFTVGMPDPLTLYSINLPVTEQNIVLGPGIYWLSFMGVYDSLGFANEPDTAVGYTLWNRKDTILDPGPLFCRDSIGIYYTHPTSWRAIWFSGENEGNSVRFWIKADVQTAVNKSGFQKPKSLVSVFPNPAAEHVLFQLDNAGIKQVEIYDVMGKLIKTVSAKTHKLKVDIRTFTNGIYFYNLIDKTDKMVDRGKFSVSK